MSATFIRHARLEAPFNDYNYLTLSTLDSLAKGTVQPGVDIAHALEQLGSLEQNLLKGKHFDILYHSPVQRAREAAIMLASRLRIPKVEPMEALREIAFSSKELITREQFAEQGMAAVNRAVLRAIAEDRLSEPRAALLERVGAIRALLAQRQAEHILFVTHGFLLQVLETLLEQDKPRNLTLQALARSANYGYLEGFTLDTTEKKRKVTV